MIMPQLEAPRLLPKVPLQVLSAGTATGTDAGSTTTEAKHAHALILNGSLKRIEPYFDPIVQLESANSRTHNELN